MVAAARRALPRHRDLPVPTAVIGRSRAPAAGPAHAPIPEIRLAELLTQQRRRFAALDPGLPEAPAPPPGDIVLVGSAGGDAAGVVNEYSWPAGSGPLLWSAAHVTELYPVLGTSGAAGAAALVSAWRARFSSHTRDPDSAAVVSWPSRDVAATRVFLDRGLVPLAVLAVRPVVPVAPPPEDPALRVRAAGPDDLDECLRLALAELAYSSQVGGSVLRPEAAEVKRTTMRDRLGRGEPTWVAERDGVVVGVLECGHTEATPGSWLGGLLPPGPWGYVNCASVAADARGTGVGRAMVAAAMPVLQHPRPKPVRGTYLYYNPPNPLSSVFWPRVGYRPLWTLWETRPASAVRS